MKKQILFFWILCLQLTAFSQKPVVNEPGLKNPPKTDPPQKVNPSVVQVPITTPTPGVIARELVSDITMNYPFCGRLSAIAVNPLSGQHIVVAGESGGLFETKNAGGPNRRWKHISDFKQTEVQDLLLTAVPGGFELYAVTANSFFIEAKPLIWKRRVDGSWQTLSTLPSAPDNKTNCYRIIEKSPGSKILYACGDFGLAYCNEAGVWNIKPGPGTGELYAVESMSDGSILAGNASGIYRLASISASWTQVSNLAKISSSTERFALKADISKTIIMASVSGEGRYWIYASADMGNSWTKFKTSHAEVPGAAGGYNSVHPDYDGYNKKLTVYTSNMLEIKYAATTGTAQEALTNMQNNASLVWNGEINAGHADTRQFAFLRQGVFPQKMIITSDGGFHIADIKTDAVVKNYSWVTENTSSGLKAVQIYNTTGHAGSFYFGTQDNGFGASVDGGRTFTCGIGGEGSVIPMYGVGSNTTNQTIVLPTVEIYTDKKIFGIGTSNGVAWNMPSLGWGCPIFLSGSTYIQDARPEEGSAIQPWKISTNNGARWSDIAPANYVRYGNLRHGFGLSERGSVDGGNKYSLYITMHGPGKKILGRLNNVTGTPNSWSYPAMTGLDGGVGIFGTQFMWESVFAVNPTNANHLLAIEQQTGKLKVSNDGGDRWEELSAFTTVFSRETGSLYKTNRTNNNAISSISFCPYDGNKILVGTISQGVFYSKDAGRTWKRLNDPGVFMVSAFYWPGPGRAYMSTYGRGMFIIDL